MSLASTFARLALLVGVTGAVAVAAERRSPNVIVILADDLGYGDLGCYGGKTPTPRIDQLAREGLRFTDFHSDSPVCSPTRAAFLTGRYSQRWLTGIVRETDPGLAEKEITIAERLGAAGYHTCLLGKWDLGYRQSPLRHGFKEFHGQREGGGDYVSKINEWGDYDWWDGDELDRSPGYAPTLITEHAVRYIAREKQGPFFLYVAQRLIHFPWMTPDDRGYRVVGTRYREKTGPLSKLGPHAGTDEMTRVVARMIEELDRGVGRIVDAVRAAGLERNTLILFVSDNGGYLSYGGMHRGEISSNGPFRGEKGQVYEGGHRVPAIAWWPGAILPGRVSEAVGMTRDLYPTLLELAGIPLPASGPDALDGVSLAPHLLRGAPVPERTLFWSHNGNKAVRHGAWKLVTLKDETTELYDLRRDLAEARNVASEQQALVADLAARLGRWERDVLPDQPSKGQAPRD